MAFNTYINGRLNQWARWTVQKVSGGLGYPHRSAFTRLAADGGFSSRVAPDVNELAWEIEQTVQALSPELKECVIVFYCQTGTIEQKLRDCHCCKRTLYYRLDRAHDLIMDMLNGYTCGEQLARPRPTLQRIAEIA